MTNRILSMFVLLVSCLAFLIFNLQKISTNENFYENANNQFLYKLKVAGSRGMIYDCNNLPLIKTQEKTMMVLSPFSKKHIDLIDIFKDEEKEKINKELSKNHPFVIEVNKKLNTDGQNIFKIPSRSKKDILALHTIGYINSENEGVIGIEKAYNSHLNEESNVEVKFTNHAGRKLISGGKCHVVNKSYSCNKGIKLTLDRRIQEAAEKISNKYITKGAVIVTKVPNCEIKACASFPVFVPENAKSYLNDETNPFINRILTSYNVGSIFKLLTSTVIIESGLDINSIYDCKGSYSLDCKKKIRCYSGISHGKIDLKEAISCSCNGYFASISKKIDPQMLLNYSKKLGFGEKITLAPNFSCEIGNLPNLVQLANEIDLAVFSFGQGCLLATPLQVAAFINTIASNGFYSVPKLVLGILNEDMNYKEKIKYEIPRFCFKESTAKILKECMLESILHGTSNKGKPTNFTAAAKTSTAETGIFKSGNRVSHSWYAGFFPFENPKYCITILAEDQECRGNPCSPIFKEISQYIMNEIEIF